MMKKKLIIDGKVATYEDPQEYSYKEIERMINTHEPELIGKALLSLGLYAQNLQQASKIIFSFSTHPDYRVRATALLCIGYLAMTHGTVPIQPTVELLQNGLNDPNSFVRSNSFAATTEIFREMPEMRAMIKRDDKSYYGFDPKELSFNDADDEADD